MAVKKCRKAEEKWKWKWRRQWPKRRAFAGNIAFLRQAHLACSLCRYWARFRFVHIFDVHLGKWIVKWNARPLIHFLIALVMHSNFLLSAAFANWQNCCWHWWTACKKVGSAVVYVELHTAVDNATVHYDTKWDDSLIYFCSQKFR